MSIQFIHPFTGNELVKDIKGRLEMTSRWQKGAISNDTQFFVVGDLTGVFTKGGYGPRVEIYKGEIFYGHHIGGDTLKNYHEGYKEEIDFSKMTLKEFLVAKLPIWVKDKTHQSVRAQIQLDNIKIIAASVESLNEIVE